MAWFGRRRRPVRGMADAGRPRGALAMTDEERRDHIWGEGGWVVCHDPCPPRTVHSVHYHDPEWRPKLDG